MFDYLYSEDNFAILEELFSDEYIHNTFRNINLNVY